MLDGDTLQFVRTGLLRYADARETVRFFEETINKSVIDALQQRRWRTFRPSTKDPGGLEIGKGKGDTFLQAWLQGSTKPNGKLRIVVLGIYWEDPVIAAAGLWNEKWRKHPVKAPSAPDERIKFNPSDQRLSLEVGKEFEPSADFKRLLDALEDVIEPNA